MARSCSPGSGLLSQSQSSAWLPALHCAHQVALTLPVVTAESPATKPPAGVCEELRSLLKYQQYREQQDGPRCAGAELRAQRGGVAGALSLERAFEEAAQSRSTTRSRRSASSGPRDWTPGAHPTPPPSHKPSLFQRDCVQWQVSKPQLLPAQLSTEDVEQFLSLMKKNVCATTRSCHFHSCLLSKVLHRVEILQSLNYWSDRRKQQRTESQTQEKPHFRNGHCKLAVTLPALSVTGYLRRACANASQLQRPVPTLRLCITRAQSHTTCPPWSVTSGTGPHPTRPVRNQPRGCAGSRFSNPPQQSSSPRTRGQLPKRTIGSCVLCSGFSLNKWLKIHSPPATLKVLPQDHHAEEGVGFEVHTHDPCAFPRYQSSTGLASCPQATYTPCCFVPHLLPICPAIRELLSYWWESRSTESPDRSSFCCHFLFRFSLHNRRGRH